MYSAVIIIKNQKELELAKAKLLGKSVIEYTLSELRRIDLDDIYLVGGKDLLLEGVIKRDNINEVVEDLSRKEGKTLLLSPLYPLATKNDYMKMLENDDEDGAVMVDENGLCKLFMLPNNRIKDFENCDFKALDIETSDGQKLDDLRDLPIFAEEMKTRINIKLTDKGVNIVDPFNTYVSQDAIIDKNTIIYPNTVIEGKCLIGKDNVIEAGSHLENVVIGDNNKIISSRITDSIIHSNVNIGPNAHVRNNTELYDNVRIGNYVEIKNSKIGKDTKIAHLAYIGDATVGEEVNIGCGAITINYDGEQKHPTVIKDHAFIGSNSNLIAPITIGEYAMVAAGSTVDKDVLDGDMAISRLYQTNKKGYGYRYINKEK